MKIAFVLYKDMTALDLVGAYEVIANWPDAEVSFVATSGGPIRADRGLIMSPTATPESLPDPDLVLVPGSSKPFGPLGDEVLLDWVRSASAGAQWMTSVCTGALVYGAAGLLKGRRATTHWACLEGLAYQGGEVVKDRVVFDGKFVTAAGVSAGIDMALTLTARVYGDDAAKMAQLAIEYDPQPPFDAGSVEKAGPELVAAVMERWTSVTG